LLDELRREARQLVEVGVCIAKLDGNVPVLDVAEVKALAKGLQVFRDSGDGGELNGEGQPIFVCFALC
jgi:hypothetical protein